MTISPEIKAAMKNIGKVVESSLAGGLSRGARVADRRSRRLLLSAVTYAFISRREIGGFRLDGSANRDGQHRDEAAAPMAGPRVGGVGGGSSPARCLAHQHQEPLRDVRPASRCTGQEGPPPYYRFALPNGMFMLSNFFY